MKYCYTDGTTIFVADCDNDINDLARKVTDYEGAYHADDWWKVPDDHEITVQIEGNSGAVIPDMPGRTPIPVSPHGDVIIKATAREWADSYGEGTGFLGSTEE